MVFLMLFIDFSVSFLTIFNALPLESLKMILCITKDTNELMMSPYSDLQMAHQQNWH
jgi:hypothetical protein